MGGMVYANSKRKLSTIISVVSLGLLVIVLYFTAYNAMGKRLGGDDNVAMCYEYEWQVAIFKPAAIVESLVLRKQVTTAKIIPYLN
jgi:hypothetical protein